MADEVFLMKRIEDRDHHAQNARSRAASSSLSGSHRRATAVDECEGGMRSCSGLRPALILRSRSRIGELEGANAWVLGKNVLTTKVSFVLS